MATQPKQRQGPDAEEPTRLRVPPPVPDGTGYRDSLGKWIDGLTGAHRDREAVRVKLAQAIDEGEAPDDPPPSEAPPPVPDGTQAVTRGAKPVQTK